MKNISVLGSTGSIGTQTLEVIAANPELYRVAALTAQRNAALLIEQALKYKPELVVICDESKYEQVRTALSGTGIKVLAGEAALEDAASLDAADLVITAIMGAVGLRPTIAAIKAKKDIGLANKETLVVAGQLITQLAREHGVKIIPVDSEHSAIYQCLVGEPDDSVEKIYLTASGGPFRGKDRSFLASVTKEAALKHPNWVMGAKITIDSASMMNKGLEVIEAKWLFDLEESQIDVIIHPQSIIHSLVQFTDGSMKAQMGLPDMKLPIHYAMAYPQRVQTNFPRFNFMDHQQLTFQQPDREVFRNLELAYQAMNQGGNMPCIINAANEVVVNAFLEDRIGFLEMSDVIERCMSDIAFIAEPTLHNYLETDQHTRIFAGQLVTK
ncbi:1-deoxy-D-xylulose 5-phosphate reductoisomerase [Pedobacter quisquiliarum]|uniref:1-deoxy-D-xylulose 5-phosphate reductoisomerase n=1 Tax=Pedobacter quisquiliarum TaxID=1834438 RepID=A0A916TYZ3_9SPHI|nr:1-deoxy-D-xylulose-5-phosphate reductoisomerase [Pedobacter quisquiliarum]GGC52812.1 1-deoxy-D-xylulose 5-phosphate reductoisomerase [Pedobacter quisquiliarum]